MPDWNHRYVQVNGLQYHYVRHGAGEPVFLIHGWPGFWYEWSRTIPALAERFDVVAPDMRGFAYTDKPDLPPERGYTPSAMASDLAALADALGFEGVHVVAHDFGAVWAQAFAREHGARLRKLVLFDPPYPGIGMRWFQLPQAFESWYQIFHQQPWAEDLVGSSPKATEIYLRHFLTHWSGNPSAWTEDDIAECVKAYSQPGALRGGFNCYRAMYRGAGYGAGAATIEHPALVLWGDRDPILPFEWSDNLGQVFTNFTLKKMVGCGHFMHREQPDAVNHEVIAFFAS